MKLKTNMLLILFCLAIKSYSQVGNDKTLYVDFFGIGIFNINEDNSNTTLGNITPFEREDDLIKFIDDHSIKNIILKYLHKITGNNIPIFPQDLIISNYPTNITSSTALAKQTALVNFLHRCRQHGVEHIAAANTPFYKSGTTILDNYFFDNIVKFNTYSTGFYTDAYFDMLYAEDDYWAGDVNSQPLLIQTQWQNYSGLHGLQHIKYVQTNNQMIPNNSNKLLLIGTYLGALDKVEDATTLLHSNNSSIPIITVADQVNLIDNNVDWVFLEFYFKGSQMSPTKYFSSDKNQGSRLEAFSKNAKATVIIPLFGSSAANTAAGSDKDYFGDYLHYNNIPDGRFNATGTSVTGTVIGQTPNGTLTDVKDQFEYYYNNTLNPYGVASGPQLTQTMKDICETNAIGVANSMNKGTAWFKYSTMPDSKYLLKVSRFQHPSRASLNTCAFQSLK